MNAKGPILILEEDPLIRALLETWLGEAGHEVTPPRDGKPVLVIADIPNPRSAKARIRSLREYAAPILLLSARFHTGLGGSAEAARRLGVKSVLPKPFTRLELLSAVREALEDTP